MSQPNQGAPMWLFSFVDLAFLMVIAMTQLASDVDAKAPDLGEMVVPHIGGESTENMSSGASKAWQLRVHPSSDETADPVFELIPGGSADTTIAEAFADAETLDERLDALAREGQGRPLLAPHEDSRSQDMLDAAAAIETHWPGRRRATVARTFDP
jgi:hypothetical protein